MAVVLTFSVDSQSGLAEASAQLPAGKRLHIAASLPLGDQSSVESFLQAVRDIPDESSYSEGADLIFNGSTVVLRAPQPSPAHEWHWPSLSWMFDLPKAKDEAWVKAKGLRDLREFGDFSWHEHAFDGDERAQQRLGMAALAAQDALARGATWSVPWTLADNTVIVLSAADVIEVMVALGENIKTAHAEARLTRAMIEAAGSFEELRGLSARWAA
jgi:hypothetical protein